jgi:hypothetical protein
MWRAALRPFMPTPVLVPLGCPSLPNRDADSSAPRIKRLAPPDTVARIDVHGSKDRVKDASPKSHATIFSRACVGCIRFVAHADDVPLLGTLLDIRCHRRVILQRGIPLPNDGPTETFVPTTPREGCCLPESRNAFHRYDTRRNRFAAKGLLPPAFAPALSLTPPTLCPQRVGTVLLIGHCKCRGTVTRDPRHCFTSRVQTPFFLVGVCPVRPCLV